jgi:hypothetical protein
MSWTFNINHVNNFQIEGYKDHGTNPDFESNEKLRECIIVQQHQTRSHDNSLFLFRGTDNIYICDVCKHFYHIDSSD